MKKSKGIILTIFLLLDMALCVFVLFKLNEVNKANNNFKIINASINQEAESMSKEYDKIAKENESLESANKENESRITDIEKENDNLVEQIYKINGYGQEETTMSESEYMDLYPEMYADEAGNNESEKIVYLTFDDGPSNLTPQFLEVLNSYDVKATFFVTYQPELADVYRQIVDSGNNIQVHTSTHDYTKIYQSVEAYMADFELLYTYIYNITGKKPDCYRFPGGSTNSYGASTIHDIAKEMDRRGFTFFDWNVSVGDGNAAATRVSIIEKIQKESYGKNKIVMLAHDSAGKGETLAALPQIIEYYKSNGFEFGVIDGSVDASEVQYIK